jgi:hypothetical protein
MTYKIIEPKLGMQAIADTSTTQQHPIGTIVRAYDSTYGVGEFIYLKGIGSTVVGSTVTYNTSSGVTALAPVGTNKAQPIAWAMSANVASQWGWYQIGGIVVAKKTCTVSLAANAAVGVLTTGLIAGTGSGKEIQGALVAVVASATAGRTTVQLVVNRPHMQGRIT